MVSKQQRADSGELSEKVEDHFFLTRPRVSEDYVEIVSIEADFLVGVGPIGAEPGYFSIKLMGVIIQNGVSSFGDEAATNELGVNRMIVGQCDGDFNQIWFDLDPYCIESKLTR